MIRDFRYPPSLPFLLPILFGIFLGTGCLSEVEGLYPPSPKQTCKTIYLVSHGWHTGIIINVNDLAKNQLLEKVNFPFANYLEIGWGDEGFYRAKEITVGIGLKALFLPSDSVLHVVGGKSPPEQMFPSSQIIPIEVSSEGFNLLIRFIDQTFQRKDKRLSVPIGKGLYGESYFFEAIETYHVFYTCNSWVAEGIRSTGFPITPFYGLTASNVIYQVQSQVPKEQKCY